MHVRTILLLFLAAHAAAHAETPSSGPLTLRELRACRQALPPSTDKYVEAPCQGKDVTGLVGKWRKELEESMGKPSWCNTKDGVALEIKSCIRSTELGYSFYVLPANTPGGGPELFITLDGNDRVTSAKWVHTQ